MNRIQSEQSIVKYEKKIKAPQINLYNRHFYLRGAEQNLIQMQREQQIQQLANKPKITPSSYNILSNRLQQKMKEIFEQFCLQEELQRVALNFDQVQSICQKICEIRSDLLQHFCSQIWLILGNYKVEGQIYANILFASLRILMDPYSLGIQEYYEMLCEIKQFEKAEHNRKQFIKQYPELEEETLTLVDFIRLWKKIRYCNPKFADSKHPHTNQNNNTITPCPKISKKSQRLAQNSLSKYFTTHQALFSKNPNISEDNQLSRYLQIQNQQNTQNRQYFSKPNYHQILYRRKLEKETMYLTQSKISNQLPLTTRTAQPSEIMSIVNNLYVVKEKKEDVDFKKLEEEEQLKLCTFQPTINSNFNTCRRRSVSPNVKGFEREVSRLKKGRDQKDRKKQAYENLGRVKNQRALSSNAPSFISRDAPKLILQINIGDRIQKLCLKGDENAKLVSKKFVHKHGLQIQMIEVLESLVSEQLNNLN